MIRFRHAAVASAAAILLAAGTAADAWSLPFGGGAQPVKTQAAQSAPAPAATVPVLAPAAVPNFRAIVQQQGPAVVGITTAGTHKVGEDELPPQFQDPFFRFFRGVPNLRMPPSQMFRGQGSGFIISSDGLILTNAHVVREAKQVTVRLSDRREFSAKVLGSDPATDIAVLRIEAKGLPTVQLGDAKAAAVGDWVLAIGAPFGFEQSASSGIVSAKGRSLPNESMVPFIQTDAAVNPGNSGGPLFDVGGRVIGVNAQIYSQSGGFQGLAFAIPIDVALRVKDQILQHGSVQHARLGVTLQDLTSPLAASFGLGSPNGALVASVQAGSAAAKAGLKTGDVITAIDGQPVQVAGDVSSRIGMARPGDKVKLQLWREKASREQPVTLGKAEDEKTAGTREDDEGEDGARLGLSLRPLEKGELRQSGASQGLLVEQVGNGPAQWAGVQRGDVLMAINGQAVRSVEQVREALKGKPRQVALLLARGGQQIFVPVQLN